MSFNTFFVYTVPLQDAKTKEYSSIQHHIENIRVIYDLELETIIMTYFVFPQHGSEEKRVDVWMRLAKETYHLKTRGNNTAIIDVKNPTLFKFLQMFDFFFFCFFFLIRFG